MTVRQLKAILVNIRENDQIYTTNSRGDIIELTEQDVYYGPVTQEDASIGINTLIISHKVR